MASKVILVFSKTQVDAISALQYADYKFIDCQSPDNLHLTGHAFITSDNEIIDEDILIWKGLCTSVEESQTLYNILLRKYCRNAVENNLKVFLFRVHDG